jgi:hypothetical protein
MNAHMYERIEDIARQAKAVVRCEFCRSNVSAEDRGAEVQAYASATDASMHGEFQGALLEDVHGLMKSVLKNADRRCPSSERT